MPTARLNKMATEKLEPKATHELLLNTETPFSLLDFMDIYSRTKCENQKMSLLRKASLSMQSVDGELLRTSMQTTILSPLFKQVVQFAIPAEFSNREHFIFDTDDFRTLTDRTEVVFRFIYAVFDRCCLCETTVETKPLNESLPLLVLVISSNIRNTLWSRDSVQKMTLLVLNQLRMLYKVDSLSEMLLLDLKSKERETATTPAGSLLGRYLAVVKTRLTKENWQANPTFVESFYWMLIQMIKFPHLSPYLDSVLPPALMLVDSHLTHHKVMGIQCLQHIAANVTNEEFRWYGRAQVVYTALRQQLYCREPDVVRALHPALLAVLPVVDKDPAAPAPSPTAPTETDAVLTLIISSASTESGIVLRRLYSRSIADFVTALGVRSVRHLGRLVSLVADYLEVFDGPEEQARFNALGVLGSMLRCAWPRVASHADAILRSLLQLLQDVAKDRSTTPQCVRDRLRDQALLCLGLLVELCPDVRVCLQAVCATQELSDVAQMLKSFMKDS